LGIVAGHHVIIVVLSLITAVKNTIRGYGARRPESPLIREATGTYRRWRNESGKLYPAGGGTHISQPGAEAKYLLSAVHGWSRDNITYKGNTGTAASNIIGVMRTTCTTRNGSPIPTGRFINDFDVGTLPTTSS
jgi:hypothetical protein